EPSDESPAGPRAIREPGQLPGIVHLPGRSASHETRSNALAAPLSVRPAPGRWQSPRASAPSRARTPHTRQRDDHPGSLPDVPGNCGAARATADPEVLLRLHNPHGRHFVAGRAPAAPRRLRTAHEL